MVLGQGLLAAVEVLMVGVFHHPKNVDVASFVNRSKLVLVLPIDHFLKLHGRISVFFWDEIVEQHFENILFDMDIFLIL